MPAFAAAIPTMSSSRIEMRSQPVEGHNPHRAYISAGSNIGRKRKNCQKGLAALEVSGESKIETCSPFYKTEPVDFKDQDWFVNCVASVATALDPFQLFDVLKRIERDAGRRQDSMRFGPRILDLDILLYDNCVLSLPELMIPHPRMHKRRFVLKPICDIDSDIVHPVLKKTMQQLLDRLDSIGQGIEHYPCGS